MPIPDGSAPSRIQTEARSRRERSAFALATWFGVGYAPKAPGTWGTLAALPLHALLLLTPILLHLGMIGVVAVAGGYAADRVAKRLDRDDPQIVVVDEVLGVLLALVLVRDQSLAVQGVAVVLFRVFDIVKPGPIAAVERLRPAGLGILADDVLAGLLAGALSLGLALLLRAIAA